jgi:hypothetical protein
MLHLCDTTGSIKERRSIRKNESTGPRGCMAELRKVRERIAEIAGRRKNVTIEEIEWIANQLKALGYDVNVRGTQHNKIFRIGQTIFNISSHNKGSKQIKRCYVDNFLDAMVELELL